MNIRPTQASTFALVQDGLLSNFSKLVNAQEQVSSGKRILRPSDDPVGSARVLTLKARASATERYGDAIDGGKQALDTGAGVLQNGGELISEARALILQSINGVSSSQDRRLIAGQLREIKSQLLDIANTQSGGRYLFAGTAIDKPAFVESDVGGRQISSYAGNRDQQQVLVGSDMRVGMGIPGSDIFAGSAPAGARFEGLTGVAGGTSPDQGQGPMMLHVRHDSSLLSPLGGVTSAAGGANDNVIGTHSLSIDPVAGTATLGAGPARALPAASAANYADFELTNAQGDRVHLDLSAWSGAAVNGTVSGAGSISLDGSNWTTLDGVSTDLELSDTASDTLLHVDVTGVHRAGDELVSFSGTVNLFDTLETIADGLENNAGLTAQEQVRRVNLVFDELDRNHDNLLAGLTTLGARSARLASLEDQYGAVQLQLSSQITQIEDVDYSQAALEVLRAEQTLQMTQSVGTRLLQTSLLNFLN